MSKNTSMIVLLAKEKTEERKQRVIETVNKMLENKEKITFYSVYQKAGVSKSFIYKNEDLRKLIESYRQSSIKKVQSKDAKDIIIDSQKSKINELEKLIKLQQKDELWKDKFDKLYEENKQLKLQLEKAYKY